MKILIAIPSKNRSEKIAKKTLSWVTKLPYGWRVFVEPQDRASYAIYVDQDQLVTLAQNDQGLGYAKREIKAYALKHGYDLIFKVDDDVPLWSPGYGSYQENKESTPATVAQALQECAELFGRFGTLGAICFNYKMFMHIQGGKPRYAKNSRLQTVYVIRSELFSGDPAIQCFEDFMQTLLLWRDGYKTLRMNYFGFSSGDTNYAGKGAGGLQSFDRVALARKEAEYILETYPWVQWRAVDRPWAIEPDCHKTKTLLNV